jgi:hypothetical protein
MAPFANQSPRERRHRYAMPSPAERAIQILEFVSVVEFVGIAVLGA